MRTRTAALLALVLVLGPPALGGEPEAAPLFPFVLPWDDASPGATNVGGLLDRPAGKLGPVVARDGHLYTGAKRFRIVGVNLCFGANFPTHDAAEKVAARMARFGINCVRFHHMDMQPPPGGLLKSDKVTLDPGQLDKLDYLIARLKDQGIYADLNLHVSRTYPGLPTWEVMPSFHKGVDNFDPRMIELQKDYARALLTHRNPYTKSRYADEPAVAIVEINNENALLHEWWGGGLDGMSDRYRGELQRQWNAWLKARFGDDTALKKAWGATARPLGSEMLRNGDFRGGDLAPWHVERHQGAKASAAVVPGAAPRLKIDVTKPGREAWHVQVAQAGLKVEADQPYTLSFRARADEPRTITVNLMQSHEPYRQLWSAPVKLAEKERSFSFVTAPAESDENARVTFTGLGATAGAVEIGAVSLRPGGVLGLDPGEALGTVQVFPKAEFSRRTPAAQRDWVRFLWDVEDRYWTGMYRFLKDELKVVAPVLGTQMGWSPAPIQAKLDVIDSHAYWQHPHFPHRQWDPADWFVKNLPMAGRPDGGTLPGLALSRVAGKPFICTEYNHSAPNTYSSETFPLVFAFAALQDWDGVFAFAYSHRHDDWDAGRIPSFFDVDQHPTKMATLPASAALFLRGDLAPTGPPSLARPTLDGMIEAVRRSGPALRADQFGVDRGASLRGPVALALESCPSARPASSAPPPAAGRGTGWEWRSEAGREAVVVDTPRSKMVVARQVGVPYDLGGVTVRPLPNRQGFAVVSLTALDGPDFRSPGRLLITATGDAENTGMPWTSPEHDSVGTHWGRRPSRVEGIPAVVTLPVPPSRVRSYILDERGRRRGGLPATGEPAGAAILTLGPQHKTLWYEVEVLP